MREYLVIVEQGENGFSAYLPDVPGCVAAGATREETLTLIREAIGMHIEGLSEDGIPIPPQSSSAEYVAV